jgi:hypothetical protein
MVVVVDEYGGTAGLVTLQDLVAEIIGDTREPEGDDEEPTLQILDEQTFLVQAQTDLEEVNELLELDLPLAEDYQTLGGFLIYQMQKIPTEGEQLHYANYEMTVESADGPRLERILIRRLEAAGEAGASLNDDDLLRYMDSDADLATENRSFTPDEDLLPDTLENDIRRDRSDTTNEPRPATDVIEVDPERPSNSNNHNSNSY